MNNDVIKFKDLSPCTNRKGRLYDGKAQLTCGFREITPEECVECKAKTSKK